jgi:hypothetical protein
MEEGDAYLRTGLEWIDRQEELERRGDLARIMHETSSRGRGDGRATGQSSRGTAGLGPEAYLFSTSQGSPDGLGTGETRGRLEGRPYPGLQQVVRA